MNGTRGPMRRAVFLLAASLALTGCARTGTGAVATSFPSSDFAAATPTVTPPQSPSLSAPTPTPTPSPTACTAAVATCPTDISFEGSTALVTDGPSTSPTKREFIVATAAGTRATVTWERPAGLRTPCVSSSGRPTTDCHGQAVWSSEPFTVPATGRAALTVTGRTRGSIDAPRLSLWGDIDVRLVDVTGPTEALVGLKSGLGSVAKDLEFAEDLAPWRLEAGHRYVLRFIVTYHGLVLKKGGTYPGQSGRVELSVSSATISWR